MARKYKVRQNDTLGAIAKRNNTTVKALLAANRWLKNPNEIDIGQTLTMPTSARGRVPSKGVAPMPNVRKGSSPDPKAIKPKIPAKPATPKPAAPKPATPKPAAPKPWQEQLTGTDRNAYAALQTLFKRYGLDSLAPKLLEYVKKGYEGDTINLLIQDEPEWKQRFIGNERRREAGLSVLSPAEYLQQEEAYKATLSAYSMPKHFYDSPEDFAGLMANDLSPDEVKSRAVAAWNFAQSTSETSRRMLKDYYGVDESYVAAYFLDPVKGQALIERQAASAGYGGIAARQNISVDRNRAESWYDRGISAGQVESGVENAATVSDDLNRIGRRFGQNYSTDDAVDEFVGGLASAKRKRETLARRESATFGGRAGTASFNSSDTGGF